MSADHSTSERIFFLCVIILCWWTATTAEPNLRDPDLFNKNNYTSSTRLASLVDISSNKKNDKPIKGRDANERKKRYAKVDNIVLMWADHERDVPMDGAPPPAAKPSTSPSIRTPPPPPPPPPPPSIMPPAPPPPAKPSAGRATKII